MRRGRYGVTDYWRDRPVFLTGCTGLLGSWLAEELVDLGAQVVGLVRDHVPSSRLFQEGLDARITIVQGSVEDRLLVERVLNEYEVCTVFHTAAQTIVGIANRNPASTFESNIAGTWSVLESARRTPTVRSIVVASSDKAYGTQAQLPYAENAPLQGRHPYDVSKSCADLISRSYYETFKLPVCVTRCGNLFGGGDLNFNRLIPGTIRSLLYGERPVIRSDGSYVRDYFYVRDAVRAYTGLAERMDNPSIHGEAFNFSNESQVSVLELTTMIRTLMGLENLVPKVLDEVENEIPEQYLTSQKARRVLGWTPRFDLTSGLRETIDWYRSYFAARDQERIAVDT